MENKHGDGCLNVKYAALQGNYWMVFGAVFTFISVFLLSRGFSAGNIGTLMALGNVTAAILQPWIASVADKSKRYTLKDMMTVITVIGVVPSAALIFAPESRLLTAGLLMVIMAAVSVQQPLVNSVNGYYLSHGKSMNFGIARGTGSLSFAAMSWIMGYLVVAFGENAVPVVICILLLTMLAVLSAFRMERGAVKEGAVKEGAVKQGEVKEGAVKEGAVKDGAVKDGAVKDGAVKEEHGNESGHPADFAEGAVKRGRRHTGRSQGGPVRRYKRFFLVLVGIALLFAFHNMVNTYLIQIMNRFGGDSADMGASVAIAAVCEIPVMVLFSKIVSRIRPNRLLKIAGLGFLLKAVAVFLAGSVMMVHASQLLQACSFAILIPASVYYSDEVMEAQDRVKGQAFITAAITVGGMVGNLFGGKLIDAAGVMAMLTAGVVCAGVGMLLLWIGAVPSEERGFDGAG